MSLNRPLRFALVGCGRISKRHSELLGLKQIENAQLAAVCDIVAEKAQAVAAKFNVPAYTSLHEMMSKEDIDVVTVLTPSGQHAANVIELAPYGKHIVVEKPMALTVKDADAMIAACKKAGVRLFVVKQNRFNVPVVRLREELDKGRFGKLVMGTVRVRWCRDQKYYDQDSWRGTWAQDGGAFTNQASHHVDLLQWMMGGEVESVYAKGGTYLVNTEAEDTGVAVLKFKNGALGVIEATTACRPKDLEGSLSILGSGGTVEISGFAVNKMRHWNFVDSKPYDAEIIQKYSVNPPSVYGYGHQAYLQHVVRELRGEEAVSVSGDEGRRSLELITAIYESMETGREVRFPFEPKHVKLGRPS